MSAESCSPRHLERRLTVVDPRPQLRIRAALEQDLHRQRVPLGNRHVERRVVVDAALIRIRAEREQQAEDVVDVRPPVRAGRVARAGQGRDERREPVVRGSIGVCPDLSSVRMKASGLQ